MAAFETLDMTGAHRGARRVRQIPTGPPWQSRLRIMVVLASYMVFAADFHRSAWPPNNMDCAPVRLFGHLSACLAYTGILGGCHNPVHAMHAVHSVHAVHAVHAVQLLAHMNSAGHLRDHTLRCAVAGSVTSACVW